MATLSFRPVKVDGNILALRKTPDGGSEVVVRIDDSWVPSKTFAVGDVFGGTFISEEEFATFGDTLADGA